MRCKYCDYEVKPFWTNKKGQVVLGVQKLRYHVLTRHNTKKEVREMIKQDTVDAIVQDWLEEQSGMQNHLDFNCETEYQP